MMASFSLNPFKTLTFTIFCTIFSTASATYYSSIALQPISSVMSPVYAPGPAFPALSPDITPLFPTPASGLAPPPAESSIPIIPSSPSPPNPDYPNANPPLPQSTSISPTGSMPESSAFALNVSVSLRLALLVLVMTSTIAFC